MRRDKCLGYQQITGLSTVKTLVPPDGATYALIQAEAQSVRWRDDGTNPSASVGMIITANTYLEYTGNPATFKFIEVTSGAILNISYYS